VAEAQMRPFFWQELALFQTNIALLGEAFDCENFAVI
jgi:hypothetical protein